MKNHRRSQKQRKSSDVDNNNKIDIVEYSLMHNKDGIVKAMKERGYKGSKDNLELYNAIQKIKKSQPEKSLCFLAEIHPDKDLLYRRFEIQQGNKAEGVREDKKIVEKYNSADGDDKDKVKEVSKQGDIFKFDTRSVVVGSIMALGLLALIKVSFFTTKPV